MTMVSRFLVAGLAPCFRTVNLGRRFCLIHRWVLRPRLLLVLVLPMSSRILANAAALASGGK